MNILILLVFTFYVKQALAINDPASTISFKENKGQISDQYYKPRTDILFSGTNGKLVYFLKNNGISYQLNRVDSWKKNQEPIGDIHKRTITQPDQITVYRLDINWLNANTNATITKGEALQGYDNYYLETCPQGALNVKSYKSITYQNLYNGIDLKWYEKNGNLKYDYIVAAGADHKQIQLEFNGAKRLSINKKGELIIKTPLGDLVEAAPFVTQNGKQLAAKWLINKNRVSFDIKNIDPAVPFVIDPLIRLWGTYYGGTLLDETWYGACDAVGNVYTTGDSNSLTNIATMGAFQTVFGGFVAGSTYSGGDAVIVKFNPSGTRLWATYYGGSGSDVGQICEIDASGDLYLIGNTTTTNSAVMSTPGTHQTFFSGGTVLGGDGFLVRFNSSGARVWGTYFGGSGDEWNYSIDLDGTGNIYVGGNTFSTAPANCIATAGAYQTVFGGSSDAFIMKFDPTGNRLWGSYYGGTGMDAFAGVLCAGGEVYAFGYSNSTASISTPGSHQPTFSGGGGCGDGILIKFDASGNPLWGTYYGGTSEDWGYNGIADLNGDIYIIGSSSTPTGTSIATPGSHQAVYGGGMYDNFMAKFNAAGVRQWGTYYGGTGNDVNGYGYIDNGGNIYFAGQTTTPSGTSIATPCTYQDVNGGAFDGFLAKFNAAGKRLWGTFYGGTGNEQWVSSFCDPSGNMFLCGRSSVASGTVIASATSHQPLYGGGAFDGFVAKFSPCIPVLPPNNTAPSLMTICAGNSTILSSSLTCGIKWFNDSIAGNLLGTGANLNTPPLSTTTTFYIEDPSCGVPGPRTAVQVTVLPLPVINITTTDPLICIGQSATLTVNGATTYTWAPSSSLNTTLDFSVVATPVVNSIYTVTGSNGSCSGTNSIPINLVPKPVPIISAIDNKVCTGSTLTLNASGAQTYSWLPANLVSNPNGSVVAAAPQTATTFTLIGINTIGIVSCIEQTSFQVTVQPYAQPLISGNVSICEGDDVALTASGGNTFNWTPNTGISNPAEFGVLVSPTTTSVYSVNVSNNGYCGTTATVLVHVNPKPKVYAGRDTTFNLKEPMIITAIGDGTLKWIYGDGISCADCPGTQIFPIKNSCYVIEAVNSFGCRATDEVCIDVSRESVLYIPNTFTPNGDGLNDEFYVSGFGFSDLTLEIFDRWGVQLFSSNDVTKGWNGFYKEQPCQIATYIYKLNYSTFGGKLTTKTGHINLVR